MAHKFQNLDWDLPEVPGTSRIASWDAAKFAVLMDMRAELRDIAISLRSLRCVNFLRIPAKLDLIEKNTRKRRRRVVPKKEGVK